MQWQTMKEGVFILAFALAIGEVCQPFGIASTVKYEPSDYDRHVGQVHHSKTREHSAGDMNENEAGHVADANATDSKTPTKHYFGSSDIYVGEDGETSRDVSYDVSTENHRGRFRRDADHVKDMSLCKWDLLHVQFVLPAVQREGHPNHHGRGRIVTMLEATKSSADNAEKRCIALGRRFRCEPVHYFVPVGEYFRIKLTVGFACVRQEWL